jgi:DNA polymerase-1
MHFMAKALGSDAEIFPIEDTSVMSYDLDSIEHGHSLDELAEIFLDYKTIKYEEVCGSGKNKILFSEVDVEKALDYAAEDADITLRLYNVLKPRILAEKKSFIYDGIDKPLIYSMKEMEENGILVDAKQLKILSTEFEKNLKDLETEIFQMAGEEFNLGSPKQIGEILYNKLDLKGKKTAGGNFQTGADVLEKMAEEHELPRKILEWRAFAKLKSTYTDSLLNLLDKNSRVHTTFNQIGTSTGRLASSTPNLQNIPIRSEEGKKIRTCFVAPQGSKIVSADYSQVELRLMAHVADVKALKEAFANGVDIHTATASKVFGVPEKDVTSNQRRDAKAINFGIIYGISQYGLAKNINTSADVAKQYIDNYFAQMPEIKNFMESTIDFGRKHGYVLTPMGRKIAVGGINDQNKRMASFAERAAINAPLQGGAADVIKLAMNAVFKALKDGNYKARMLLQVHDELVFECPDDEVAKLSEMIKDKMENVVDYAVPLTVEVGSGQNWTEAH